MEFVKGTLVLQTYILLQLKEPLKEVGRRELTMILKGPDESTRDIVNYLTEQGILNARPNLLDIRNPYMHISKKGVQYLDEITDALTNCKNPFHLYALERFYKRHSKLTDYSKQVRIKARKFVEKEIELTCKHAEEYQSIWSSV